MNTVVVHLYETNSSEVYVRATSVVPFLKSVSYTHSSISLIGQQVWFGEAWVDGNHF